jgi:serine phosphatase RsbU (regulator of sigma subunit)
MGLQYLLAVRDGFGANPRFRLCKSCCGGDTVKEILERVNRALSLQEDRVERIASQARMGFIAVIAVIALLNAPSVTAKTNSINFGAIGVALGYSLTVSAWLKHQGYRAAMKYATSLLDLTIVHLALLAYALQDIPIVALKNPVFLIVYPILGMTVFRYDPRLTLISGGYALACYGILFSWVAYSVPIKWGDYASEFFGPNVAIVGQLTKLLVLALFIVLMTVLARYTRFLFHKLIRNELELRQRNEKIERELELASQVQAHLLPRSCPVFEKLSLHGATMEGNSVGGDYYDLIPLSPDSVLLIIADVSGKGVPAALIMSEVRAATHLCTSMGLGIKEVVERINRLIYESTAAHNYVTAFIAEIDASVPRIRYINAGHPPPLLFCEQQVHRLLSGTYPLGLFPSLGIVELQCEELSPGSLLVACTDGVSERTNSAGEEFGDFAINQLVAEHGTMDLPVFARNLLATLKHFGNDRPFDDDATVVVAKFAGRGLEIGNLAL